MENPENEHEISPRIVDPIESLRRVNSHEEFSQDSRAARVTKGAAGLLLASVLFMSALQTGSVNPFEVAHGITLNI